jgi:hypothetical protein
MERQLDSSTLSLASPSSSGHHLADSWAKRAGRENANCSCSCGTRARISSECTSRLLPRSSHRMTPGSTEDQSCPRKRMHCAFLVGHRRRSGSRKPPTEEDRQQGAAARQAGSPAASCKITRICSEVRLYRIVLSFQFHRRSIRNQSFSESPRPRHLWDLPQELTQYFFRR